MRKLTDAYTGESLWILGEADVKELGVLEID